MEPVFLEDFAKARELFRSRADRAKAKLYCLESSLRGPHDEELATDIAWIGPERPRRAVLVTSGLHGVEGFTGSAIQSQLFESHCVLPSDTALVLVHALNPWGMAWIARPNENNVDLNRNFLLDGTIPETPPLYRELDALLNPPSPPSRDFFLLKLIRKLATVGFHGLKQVIAGGQYQFPKGLFFGGTRIEPNLERYLAWLVERLSGITRLVAIDIHTGLGAYASDFLFIEPNPDIHKQERLKGAFGNRLRVQTVSGTVYRCSGSHLSALEQVFPEARVDALCHEFGTFPAPWVLKSLREETRWRLHGGGSVDHPCKRALVHMFNPRNRYWRRRVLQLGQERIMQAISLLDAE